MGKKLEQKKLGTWWGTFKLLAQHATSYVQYFVLAFTSITAYDVIRKWLSDNMDINLPFWGFVVVIALIVVILFLWEYRYSWRSFFGVWNRQIWDAADNPLKVMLEEMDAKWDKRFKEMENKLDGKKEQ
jgi:Na+/melibiose symporter-like transporter